MHERRLCIDSDALVNLLALESLEDAIACLNLSLENCCRLPSVEAQLRRAGWINDCWPKADRVAMLTLAQRLSILPPPQSLATLERLISRHGIDEGEAYILAHALEDEKLIVLSGDSRMIRALHEEPGLVDTERLRHRLIAFPQILATLVQHLSVAEVEHRWRKAAPDASSRRHKGLAVLFGSHPTSPESFWEGYRFQHSKITDHCGPDWLYPL
jgi:hypothetical protein